MKKAVLVLGILYVFWGLWYLFIIIPHFEELYRDFGAQTPNAAPVLPLAAIFFGLVTMAIYFNKKSSEKVMLIFIVLGISFVLLFNILGQIAGLNVLWQIRGL